jgi:hypothetical protein
MAGLAVNIAVSPLVGVSSEYIAVTTVLPPAGTTVKLSVGAPNWVASEPFGSEIRVTPNAKSATRGKNFK